MTRFGFGKREKLKSRKAIEALFTQGKSFSQFPLRVMYLFLPVASETEAGIQVAVSASKRHFKKAVDRNRIKRLLREAYRLQKESLVKPARNKKVRAHVFFMFVDKTLPDFETTKDAMSKCLQQLVKAIEKHEAVS
jgi:ribonuclease P protein component